MKKPRTRKYLKSLTNKAVNFYFENPNTNLKELSEKFNLGQQRISKAISEKIKKKI